MGNKMENTSEMKCRIILFFLLHRFSERRYAANSALMGFDCGLESTTAGKREANTSSTNDQTNSKTY
jgi:hypothetical protein